MRQMKTVACPLLQSIEIELVLNMQIKDNDKGFLICS